MELAKLYSQAVDYAKKGVPVNITNDFPRPLIKFKPDWNKAEVTGARELDYYESDRALGHLFRNIHLDELGEPSEGFPDATPDQTPPLEDVISQAIAPLIQHTLEITAETPRGDNLEAKELYDRFLREMRSICMTHTLLDLPDVQLTEEEVVLGVILAKSTQPRLRKDRTYRVRLHAETLVRESSRQKKASGQRRTFGIVYRRRGQCGAGLSITGTRNTSRASHLLYLASFWIALSSSVHYPAPELELYKW